MSKENPLQKDMFSGELKDTRSAYRKQQDKKRGKPRQAELFSAQETVQLGVNPRPWLKTLPSPTLALEIQDVRTDEEKEHDWWREAQKQIAPMFDDPQILNDHVLQDHEQQAETGAIETTVVYDAPNLRQIGYRADVRRASIPVRSRK